MKRRFNLKLVLTLMSLGLIISVSNAQDINNLAEMSLEDLMNMEVSVASSNSLSLRETPGIVTVITRREIENSGARDLMDVLRTIPGFEVSGDIDNTIGIGVRGNFANEGKALLLLDGQQMNENGYGTFILGNRFLLDNIQKIEIIRGPGSAIYGGLAELAVINIVTLDGTDLEGGYISSTYGISNGVTSRTTGQFGFGKSLGEKTSFSFTADYGTANISNESIFYSTNYVDDNGASTTFNHADSSQLKNINLNFGLKSNGFEFKAIYQDHLTTINSGEADWMQVGGIYLGGKYQWDISDNVTIVPEVTWKKENPWSYKGNLSDLFRDYYLLDAYRTRGKITGRIKASENINITIGSEYFLDKAVKPEEVQEPFVNGSNEVTYTNFAAFSEIFFKSNFANVIVGARFDNHSQFGSAFVPRFALTKAWDNFHMKGLVSRAFKAPVIYNYESNPNINPEFTTVAELEAGYLVNDNMSLVGNIFYINIDDPIIYEYDAITLEDNYLNANKLSTIGFELEYRLKYNWGFINSSYSYYQNNNSQADSYEVDNNKKLLRGFPSSKIAVTSGINAGDKFVISPTLIYTSQKVGYFAQEEFWSGEDFFTYDASLIFNLSLNYAPSDAFKVSVTGYDLFNQRLIAANAYDALYAGTPMMGREFAIKLKYGF